MKDFKKDWWKEAVVYQVYPRSFQDSNGDGIGDLPGITSRLDYLAELGIDAIWLSPVYCSPQDDGGYDISDYRSIDPMFGTMEDFEELVREGEKRGIGIVMDLVLNHTSDEHAWFKEAKKGKDNPYHDYYVWRDGKPDKAPNELRSNFSGSAWEYVPELGQYYLHLFSKKQPDLNWSNPKVRQELYDMIRFWMEKGVWGFRLDVIDQVGKEPDRMITENGPRLHEYLRELAANTFGGHGMITVGEAWGSNLENAPLYSNPDGSEFSMIFQFEHMVLDQKRQKWDPVPLELPKLKRCLAKWQTGLHGKGWNSLFWDNHDLPRIVSRFGNDGEFRVISAKMLALVLHGLEGTPYIFEGEELGMTNVQYELEDYRDIESLNMVKERSEQGYSMESIMESIRRVGRDNARTPMQWDNTPNAGFCSEDVTPWIRVNPNYTTINAKDQLSDENSIFHFYRKLIVLRKSYPVIREGSFRLLMEEDPDLFVYERLLGEQKLFVAANFHGTERSIEIPEGKVLIHNYEDVPNGVLRPYEALMVLIESGQE